MASTEMATGSIEQLPYVDHQISEEPDLAFHIVEYGVPADDDDDADGNIPDAGSNAVAELVPQKNHVFHVSKAIFESIPTFAHLLRGVSQGSTRPAPIELKGDNPIAMGIWLWILHGKDAPLRDADIQDVQQILVVAFKYGFDPARAMDWFKDWYDAYMPKAKSSGNMIDRVHDCRKLLFPSHTFNHAQAFLDVTKYLAYNMRGHITELGPFGNERLHLPARIIQQLNAAKGRLRNILHRELYKPVTRLLKAECTHKADVLFAYELALHETGAWPIESTGNDNSINGLLGMLQKNPVANYPDQACSACRCDFGFVVRNAVRVTKNYFDGLCLNCINHSKLGNFDTDYWHHYEMWKEAGRAGTKRDCLSVEHGEPTWYHSFMGRRETRIKFEKQHNDTFRNTPRRTTLRAVPRTTRPSFRVDDDASRIADGMLNCHIGPTLRAQVISDDSRSVQSEFVW